MLSSREEVKEAQPTVFGLDPTHPAIPALTKLSKANLLTKDIQLVMTSSSPLILDGLANIIIFLSKARVPIKDIEAFLTSADNLSRADFVLKTETMIQTSEIEEAAIKLIQKQPHHFYNILKGMEIALSLPEKETNLAYLAQNPKEAKNIAEGLKDLNEMNLLLSQQNRRFCVSNFKDIKKIKKIMGLCHFLQRQPYQLQNVFNQLICHREFLDEIIAKIDQHVLRSIPFLSVLKKILENNCKKTVEVEKLTFCHGIKKPGPTQDKSALSCIFFNNSKSSDSKNLLRHIFSFLPSKKRGHALFKSLKKKNNNDANDDVNGFRI